MANAGCINAYNCDGCLIQTLQNLDSACIGVGVQYTAPNPLDDKRLDYIKYTDKCGCTCCLSGENEILIYATNGVIKNLTLTNDDVNEAIKIQWNDIFGSNRAKTIVRYKTGSAPVSITDGTLAVEETTKNQYSSTPFSLSGVLDETTYYISAFAVDSNGTIINVQGNQITTDFFVPGYKKVEYIESQDGKQRINTGIIPKTTTKIHMKLRAIGGGSEQSNGGSPYGAWYNYQSNGRFNGRFQNNAWWFGYGSNNGANYTISGAFNQDAEIENYVSNGVAYHIVNGTTKTYSGASFTQYTGPMYLFIRNLGSSGDMNSGNNIFYRFYWFKIYENGTLVRDFVPCYRKSDNVVGMIDMVNKVFYQNVGLSGSFTKGPDV